MEAVHGIAFLLAMGSGLFFLVRRRFILPESLQSLLLFFLAGIQLAEVIAFYRPDHYFLYRTYGLYLESFLPLVVSFIPLWLFQGRKLRSPGLFARMVIIAGLFFAPWVLNQSTGDLVFNPDVSSEPILFLGSQGFWFFLVLTLSCCYGLFQLEQGMLWLDREERWRGKYQILGWGLILATQAFCYSQGVIYRSYDLAFLPMKSISLGAGALLILYSRYWRGEVAKIMVSRRFAMRSLVLLVVGVYFLGMATLGEGFRFLPGAMAREWLGILFVLVGGGLLVLFLMERPRRLLYVLLHKHFYQNKYDYREEWLEFTRRLSRTENERHLYRTILEYVSSTFGLQGAALYVRHDPSEPTYQGYFFDTCSRIGMPAHILDEAPLFFALSSNGDWIMDKTVPAEQNAFGGPFKDLPLRFLVPVSFGEDVGAVLALGDPLNRSEHYGYEDFDLMRIVAAQAGTMLQSLQLRGQLANAREMAAIGKVSTFVVHDLKNVVTGLGMMLENAHEYLDDPEFQADMLETVGNSVNQMNELIHRLRHLKAKPSLNLQQVFLNELVTGVVERIPDPRILESSVPVMAEVDPGEIQKVVINLLHNALDASADHHCVKISTGLTPRPFIRVDDEGCGMTEAFVRDRLFKPLETTKSKGLGIGLYQCRNIIETHGGEIQVQSEEGKGSSFTVYFPQENEGPV